MHYPARDLTQVIERATAELRSLHRAHVLITGASGFIGSWMLDSLVAATSALHLDVQITALSRNWMQYPMRETPFFVAKKNQDIRHPLDMDAPHYIIHCASAASPAENKQQPRRVVEMIEEGTANVVRFAERVRARRLLVLSSGSVYEPSDTPHTEQSPVISDRGHPVQPFALAKLRAEQAALRSRVATVSARIFALIGPGCGTQFAAMQFLRDAKAGKPVTIKGDGLTMRSYLYAADLAAWLWVLLIRGLPGTAYNVGSPIPITLRALADLVADLPYPPVAVDVRHEHAAGMAFVPDTTLARERFALDAWTDLPNALQHTWNWMAHDRLT